MKLRNLILKSTVAGLLLGLLAVNIIVLIDRGEEYRDVVYELKVGHADFRFWLAEAIDDCSPLVFQRRGETAQHAMDRLPDEEGCLVFRPGIQPTMSNGYAFEFSSRFTNTLVRDGHFREYNSN